MKKYEVLTQLDVLIKTGDQLTESFERNTSGYRYYKSSQPEARLRAFVTSALATIVRIAGKDSEYYENIPQEPLSSQDGLGPEKAFIEAVTGALTALRDAVDQGWLQSLE
ncbi:MAG: hypothetical protein J4G05_03520 [Chlorobi bacterium]|nr:hypothetical protein [Chlorobiota bacterium]